MWSGTINQIPTGWRLCDGSPAVTIPAGSVPGQPLMTSIIIPDLRNRFIIGATAGTTTTITGTTTQTGGSKDAVVVSHTHTISNIGESRYGANAANPGVQLHPSEGDSSDYHQTPTLTVSTTGVSGTNQNLAPYYALAFIIYTGI